MESTTSREGSLLSIEASSSRLDSCPLLFFPIRADQFNKQLFHRHSDAADSSVADRLRKPVVNFFSHSLDDNMPVLIHGSDAQTPWNPLERAGIGDKRARNNRHEDFLANAIHFPVQLHPAFVKQHHSPAEPFDVVHVMGGKKNGRSFSIKQ